MIITLGLRKKSCMTWILVRHVDGLLMEQDLSMHLKPWAQVATYIQFFLSTDLAFEGWTPVQDFPGFCKCVHTPQFSHTNFNQDVQPLMTLMSIVLSLLCVPNSQQLLPCGLVSFGFLHCLSWCAAEGCRIREATSTLPAVSLTQPLCYMCAPLPFLI